MSASRALLRLAAREVVRARARSLMVLVLITVPVMAVCAAAVLIATQHVDSKEGLQRRLGGYDARVTVASAGHRTSQGVDPDTTGWGIAPGKGDGARVDAATIRRVLGGVRVREENEGTLRVRATDGIENAGATELDLRSPLVRGMVTLTRGRLPRTSSEVVVSQALADRGSPLGSTLATQAGHRYRVVGIVRSGTLRTASLVFGLPGSLHLPGSQRSWLVSGRAITWNDVQRLDALGALVLSRAVVLDPPPASEIGAGFRSSPTHSTTTLQVAALIAAMAVLEVVLLAGPAFAVGARRQARALALMAASGATTGQVRRVVLGTALVLGGVAAVVGTTAGIALARLLAPWLQGRAATWFGPFDVPWHEVLGIAAFGLVSALLAATVPAWLTSRQDVVAVLAGRRGDRPATGRMPVVGLVLIALGVASAAYGALHSGVLWIAVAEVVAVLGTVLVVAPVLVVLGRVSGRLPLALRYATRDATRHRARTVPAVAAVAATVAGVVAISIASSSQSAQRAAMYTPLTARGDAIISIPRARDATRLLRVVQHTLPAATVTGVMGVPSNTTVGGHQVEESLELRPTGSSAPPEVSSANAYNTLYVVAHRLPSSMVGISAAARTRADDALAAGGVVGFSSRSAPARSARVTRRDYSTTTADPVGRAARATLPAAFIAQHGTQTVAVAVLSPSAARRLGLRPVVTAYLASNAPVTGTQHTALTEAVNAVTGEATVYVESGPPVDDRTRIVVLVLTLLGVALMLGGTLTATALSLSDARGDLATLSAVGAAPRTRRRVAAAYALVVGGVGALLGAAVGFVPGIAASFPLTRDDYPSGTLASGGPVPSHFLDVPWLLVIGVVVALPLVTALLVGLTARSRLPLVARID